VNGSGNGSTHPGGQRTFGSVVKILRRIALLLLALPPLPALADFPDGSPVRNRAGDDARWAAPDWDDRGWAAGGVVPARTGVHWVRFHFEAPSGGRLALPPLDHNGFFAVLDGSGPIDCIRIAVPASYDFFWDGRLIGRSGKVGRTREEEVPGLLDHAFPIPAELLGPGRHVIAIRLSSFYYNFSASEFGLGFAITSYLRIRSGEINKVVYPLISVGGSLLVALISGALFWLAGRWRPLLLCSIISLLLAFFYFLVAWRWIYNDPYDWFAPRLIAVTGVMTLVAWLFPWLLIEQFMLPRRAWWLAATVPLLIVAWTISPFFEIKTLWLCRAMLAVSAGLAGWAMWRRRPGAWCVFAVALAGLLAVRAGRQEFVGPSFFATFGGLVLVVFATLGVQVRDYRRQAEAATLATVRLELELLKKNLQPHFLLNTLAVLTEIVERDPRGAVKLIEDLAHEFRTVACVSAEQLIPLGQELELCRAHLRVMSVRTGRAWSLEATGVEDTALVPPAVFLTLIENGFAHQRVAGGGGAFGLRMERTAAGATRFTFLSPGEVQTDAARPVGGTGLRYVQARLEESFPGRWWLNGELVPGGWRTVIEIGKNTKGARA